MNSSTKIGKAHEGVLELKITPQQLKEFSGLGNSLFGIVGLVDPQGRQLDFSGHYRHLVSDQSEGIKGLFVDPHFGEDISCGLIGRGSSHLLDFKVKPKGSKNSVHYVLDHKQNLARDIVRWNGYCFESHKKIPVQCLVTAYHNRFL